PGPHGQPGGAQARAVHVPCRYPGPSPPRDLRTSQTTRPMAAPTPAPIRAPCGAPLRQPSQFTSASRATQALIIALPPSAGNPHQPRSASLLQLPCRAGVAKEPPDPRTVATLGGRFPFGVRQALPLSLFFFCPPRAKGKQPKRQCLPIRLNVRA